MNSRMLPKSLVVATLILMLSISVSSPAVFAKGRNRPEIQWVVDEENHKEAIVIVNREEFYLTASLYGEVWKVDSINGVEQHSNWIQFDVWIERPPYPWFIWIGSVPSFRIHLDGPTAINTGTALAALTFLLGIATGYTGGIAVVAFAIIGLISIGYFALWRADHRPDNSFDLWVPYDWYNVFVTTALHMIYMATCCYWWLSYMAVPFIIGSHSSWC